MQAVESLIGEHQVISRLADALEEYVRLLQSGPACDPADLARFAAAFTDFAECIHHEKEENILLPVLSRHGMRWESGVLPAVRRQHRQEAYLIDVLRQAGERAGSWNAEDRRHISAAAQALVEFQRSHHLLESTQLFPLIPLQLNESDASGLQAALEKFDREHHPRRASALELTRSLIDRYAPGVDQPVSVDLGLLGAADAAEASECCLGPDE